MLLRFLFIYSVIDGGLSPRAVALWIRDVHGNGIPNGTGNPMGMGIKHRIENGNGREWETTSVGMGITCTPMGI